MRADVFSIPKWVGAPDLRALSTLFKDGPQRASVIASAAGISKAATTGLLDRFAKRGLLRRQRGIDRRGVTACLTEDGLKLARMIFLAEERIEEMNKSSVVTHHAGTSVLADVPAPVGGLLKGEEGL